MTDGLNIVEAKKLNEGLRYEWEAFRSQFAEAVDDQIWETLGYTRRADWLADTFGDMTLPGIGDLTRGVGAPAGTTTARTSRPGRTTEVTPRFKERHLR